jgi:hypothetical protein
MCSQNNQIALFKAVDLSGFVACPKGRNIFYSETIQISPQASSLASHILLAGAELAFVCNPLREKNDEQATTLDYCGAALGSGKCR